MPNIVKGTIQQDHFPRNRFLFSVVGLPGLTVIAITGLEQTLDNAQLPDRTKVTGGATQPLEIEVVTPAHHEAEQAAWNAWWLEAQNGVPTYKKNVTLVKLSSTGLQVSAQFLIGCFPIGRSETDHEMENEGEDHRLTWTLSVDDSQLA